MTHENADGLTVKLARDLVRGDRVEMPNGIVRTVSHSEQSQWLSNRGVQLVNVMYLEGRTAEWGAGNSTHPGDEWVVVPWGTVAVTIDHNDGPLVEDGPGMEAYDYDDMGSASLGWWPSLGALVEDITDGSIIRVAVSA